MTIYLFTHTTDPAIIGATDEPSGAKLPALPKLSVSLPPSPGKWVYASTVAESNEIGLAFIGFSDEEAQAEIEKQGYYLHRPKINFTVTFPER